MRQQGENYVAKATDIRKEKRRKIYSKNYPTLEERELIKAGKNPNNRSAKEVEAIKNDVFPPKNFIGREWFYFRELWTPYHFKSEYRPWPDCRFAESSYPYFHKGIGKIIVYGTLLPFMIFTFIYLFRRKRKEVYFLYSPIFI